MRNIAKTAELETEAVILLTLGGRDEIMSDWQYDIDIRFLFLCLSRCLSGGVFSRNSRTEIQSWPKMETPHTVAASVRERACGHLQMFTGSL